MLQARKLFILLNKVPLDVFMEKVAPDIRAKFHYIIPAEYLASDNPQNVPVLDHREENCLRHATEDRIRPANMADTLYHCGRLNMDEYR